VEEQARPAAGEVRTFLIADVRGYTRFTLKQGDEAAAALAARFAALAREVVAAHGGEVIELRGDEALAVFSSARQALRAAIALEDAFARETPEPPTTPLKVGIGLDAGEAVPVERGYRGGALNLAARLCSLAGSGEVLASEGVIHLAGRMNEIRYVERGEVQLKGFDDPVPVVEVHSASRPDEGRLVDAVWRGEAAAGDLPIGSYLGSLPANRLVGREAEVRRLGALIDAVLQRKGRLILLAGEPGVGKTRLAQEATLSLRNREFLVATGRCYEPQHSVPFYPFVDTLTALYAAAPAEIRREVPARWSELALLLPAVGLPVADYSGSQDQLRLFWAITGFVQTLACTSPVALLLDDLQWADASSLELLQHLARHTGGDRVLLLGTYRDVEVNRRHPLEAAVRDLWREGLIERLEVRRLGREQTGELIAAVMGQEEAISDEFTDLLFRRTEGNAFFVQQVLHAMVERGDMVRKDGRWDRKEIEEIEVPESVRSVVGQRLSRLAEETQEILREASVLGQSFRFDDLRAMSGRQEDALERGLEAAAAAGMVRETGRDGFGFDHALTQGALYAELSSRRRRRLHLAVGEAIEALPEQGREGRAAELAWHFLEADDAERALGWSIAAGDGAETVFAHSDAEHHYRVALHLAGELRDRPGEMEAREKLGATLTHLNRYDEALEIYEPALGFYREQDDFEAEVRLTAAIGWILFELVRRDEGIALLRPVLERWERDLQPESGKSQTEGGQPPPESGRPQLESGPPLISASAASLHVALGNLYWSSGQLDEALRLLDRAAELSSAVRDDRTLGMAESRRGVVLEYLGRIEESLEAYTRSIPLLEATADLETLGRSLNNRALIYGDLARHPEAWADLERSLDVARRLGDPSQIGWALGTLALISWLVDGDWERARSYADELMSLEPQLRGTRSSGHLPTGLWLRLVVGGDASALQDLEGLATEGEQENDVALWMLAQYWLAEWDVLQGFEEMALARDETVLGHPGIENQARRFLERRLAHVLVACGRLERAETLISEYLTASNPASWMHPWPTWLAIKAQLSAARGYQEEARAGFDEAMTLARQRNVALELAETAHAYGEMLARSGEPAAARARFEEALSVFRRMSAGPYVERTERALAELG
jgi:class 3 adenylate cyclase/tetratricopeptide (TPR) repeat protein